jgi:predicted metal-dependent hydrolase
MISCQTVTYTIKRSSTAKHARLEVRAGSGLTVVVPRSYNLDQVSDLLSRKSRWILDKIARYATGHSVTELREHKSGDFIPYLGRRLKLVTRHNSVMTVGAKLEKNRLLVDLEFKSRRLNLILEWWYRQQAESHIRNRADELSQRLSVSYNRLTIRGARTRWGSCSKKGNINFNWKLMMVPEPVIDYVIIHELAHLKEMNHSKDFWKLVAEHCPQWRKHRKWLKEHEVELASTLFA